MEFVLSRPRIFTNTKENYLGQREFKQKKKNLKKKKKKT